jgi:hypothetical protein
VTERKKEGRKGGKEGLKKGGKEREREGGRKGWKERRKEVSIKIIGVRREIFGSSKTSLSAVF